MASPVESLNTILNEWHEHARTEGYSPLKTLESLCDLLEEQTEIFYKIDPDPFDERHPARIDPEGGLGLILKAILKHDDFMNTLVNEYMSSRNYSPEGGNTIISTACRLFLDILPGMETSFVLSEADGLLTRLYDWAKKSDEPLSSYSIGIIASAMEIQELAGESKEKNAQLVPILLKKLKTLFNTKSSPVLNKEESVSERAFSAIFDDNKNKQIKNDDTNKNINRKSSKSPSAKKNSGSVTGNPKKRIKVLDDSEIYQDNNSNSNWAEMQPQIIGSYKMSPLTSEMKQRLILKYLTALGGYQEHVPAIFEHDALNLLFHYIEMASLPHNNTDACLTFKALHYLASLFVHKKFALAFINAGGLQKLLAICRPSMAATGVSLCLYYLAYYEEAMEKICQLPYTTLQKLIEYVLWLLVCSHQSGRTHAVLFFSVSFSFKIIIDIFDEQDGLRKLFNNLSTLDILNNENIETAFTTEDDLFVKRQSCRYSIIALKKYFETQFLLLSICGHKCEDNLENEHIQIDPEMEHSNHSSNYSNLTTDTRNQSIDQRRLIANHMIYKPLKITPEILLSTMRTVSESFANLNEWKPMQELLNLGGISLFLKIIMLAGDWMFHGRAELVRNALDILKFATFLQPSVQLQLCKTLNFTTGDEVGQSSLTGMSTILMMAEGTIVSDPEAQKSALAVIINCVSGQINAIKTPILINKRRSAKSMEDVLSKMWKCIRNNNGLMVLLNLLSIKAPITDADEIRYLACKALYGLMRSDTVLQIASKLPIFNNGQLQQLMKEPVLQDNLSIHLQFCQYAKQLLQTIKGQKSPSIAHLSLDQMHRANIVAQTKINFSKRELIHLIYNYLLDQGLKSSSSALIEEAWDTFFTGPTENVVSLAMSMGNGSNLMNTPANSQQQAYFPQSVTSMACPKGALFLANPNSTTHHLRPFPSRSAAFVRYGVVVNNSNCNDKENDMDVCGREGATPRNSPYPGELKISPNVPEKKASTNTEIGGDTDRGCLGKSFDITPHATPTYSRSSHKRRRKRVDKFHELATPSQLTMFQTTTQSVKNGPGEKLKVKLNVVPYEGSVNKSSSAPRLSSLVNGSGSLEPINDTPTQTILPTSATSAIFSSAAPSPNLNLTFNEHKKPNWQRSDSVFYQQSPALRKLHSMQRLGETNTKLESIITEYLREQHSHCQNPMGTCPPFSLLAPHQCPIQRNSHSASLNITKRYSQIPIYPLYGGLDGSLLNKKYVYSRLKGGRVIRDPDEDALFTCCTFQPGNSNVIYIGTESGELKSYNMETSTEENTYTLGNTLNPILWCRVAPTHSQSFGGRERNDSIITTYSFEQWRPCSYVWNLSDTTQYKHVFESCHHPTFNTSGPPTRLLATENEKAYIFDIQTGTKMLALYDATLSNMYAKNRAVFNSTDDYVLSDGILWDSESGYSVHKFDKLNPNISGIFHPNGFEVIINTEVWDLRTYKLLNTVPSLDQCRINFNPTNDIIYGLLHIENEDEIGAVGTDDEFGMKTCFDTSVRVLDANTYSSLVTLDTRKTIFDLCPDPSNRYVSIIESCSKDSAMDNLLPRHEDDDDRLCRLYEIGRTRDVLQEAEDDETEAEHDIESDGSSDEDDEFGDFTLSDQSDYTSDSDNDDSSYVTISSEESQPNSLSSRRPQSNMTTTTSNSSTLYNLVDTISQRPSRNRNSRGNHSGRRGRNIALAPSHNRNVATQSNNTPILHPAEDLTSVAPVRDGASSVLSTVSSTNISLASSTGSPLQSSDGHCTTTTTTTTTKTNSFPNNHNVSNSNNTIQLEGIREESAADLVTALSDPPVVPCPNDGRDLINEIVVEPSTVTNNANNGNNNTVQTNTTTQIIAPTTRSRRRRRNSNSSSTNAMGSTGHSGLTRTRRRNARNNGSRRTNNHHRSGRSQLNGRRDSSYYVNEYEVVDDDDDGTGPASGTGPAEGDDENRIIIRVSSRRL